MDLYAEQSYPNGSIHTFSAHKNESKDTFERLQYQNLKLDTIYFKMIKTIFSVALFVAALAGSSHAFSSGMQGPTPIKASHTQLAAASSPELLSRSAFVQGAVGAALLSTMIPSSAAVARGVQDANFDGTESAANAKNCMSRCLYESIKAGNSKEDSLKMCSEQCATGEGQLTSFTPGN